MQGNGISLIPGTYWLDWGVGGTLASGPFCPPISILGTWTTGNSLQNTGAAWVALTDGSATGIQYAQGLPFEINYTISFFPCFALNITQAGPGGNVTLTDSGGIPGFNAINVITLNTGAYPAGWLYGVDIPLFELGNLLSSGRPVRRPLRADGHVHAHDSGTRSGSRSRSTTSGLMLNGNQHRDRGRGEDHHAELTGRA